MRSSIHPIKPFPGLSAALFVGRFSNMQAALNQDLISVDDYLAGEQNGQVKHEYIAGAVYGMAGGTTDHNQIAINIVLAARGHLKGTSCRVFTLDVKLRLKLANDDVFYYPDVMVG